jgi:hypothetical protein
MDCVQGSNRFARKRLTGSIDDVRGNSQDLPVSGRPCQMSVAVCGLCFRQFFERYRAQEHPVAFNQRQIRADSDLRGAKEAPNGGRRRLVQEPREDSA